MTTNQIIIYIAIAVGVALIVSILIALIRSGILQSFYQRIKVTQGFKTFKRIMSVILGILVAFFIGYFIFTAVQL